MEAEYITYDPKIRISATRFTGRLSIEEAEKLKEELERELKKVEE